MRKFLIPVLMFLIAGSAAASEPRDVTGVWVVESRSAIVEITECSKETVCGHIVWVSAPVDAQPKDDNNPDPELRDKPLVGSQLLWGFKAKGETWSGGKIYDAESGKTYKSKMKLLENGALEVKGCVGPICQGQIWTPVKLSR